MMNDTVLETQAILHHDDYTPSGREKNIAALTHATVLLTFVVAVTTGGIGTLLTMLVPVGVWLYYRDRSPYLAFQAMEAALFQLGATGLVLLASGGIGVFIALVWIITGLLSLILVGLLLVPIAILISAVGGFVAAVLPLIFLGYGLYGAWMVYNLGNYRFPWLTDWLETRMNNPTT